jgi:hypothetical protein
VTDTHNHEPTTGVTTVKKKKYRPKCVVLIQACDWCGGAFATQMSDGLFCHPVCQLDFRDHQRQTTAKRGAPLTVSELIDLADPIDPA